MTSGFIYAKLPDDTTIFAKSADLSGYDGKRKKGNNKSSSSSSSLPLFTSIDSLVNGDSHIESILVSSSSGKSNKSSPVISVKSYQNEYDPQQLPISVVVGLVMTTSNDDAPNNSGGHHQQITEQRMQQEATALNEFAHTCVCATSKPCCESLWNTILNFNNISSGDFHHQKSLFSNSSLSPCGFPRSIIDRAVPLSFCFVPPPVLGQEDIHFVLRRFQSPLSSNQSRLEEISSSMPWPHDYNLTEHIVDTLRIFSGFVADSIISNVQDLLETNFACELLPPRTEVLNDPKHPQHHSTITNSMITPSEAAMGNFFGRGVWFTGLFSANDGAVISATPGYFRLRLEDQILVSSLASSSSSSLASSSSTENDSVISSVKYARNITGAAKKTRFEGDQQENNNASSSRGPAIQATTLPPHLNFVETQVQFFISTSGCATPIAGSIAVFTIDENLRFVVGLQRHQQQLSQRTNTEIFMWTNQLLANSMQSVSAREVAKYCASQQRRSNLPGFLAACLQCCSSSGGDDSTSASSSVPHQGLRQLSYLTPGLLRHYSSILESSVASVVKQAIFGGKYFGVPSTDLTRLNEAASVYEFRKKGVVSPSPSSSSSSSCFRYYIETTLGGVRQIANNGFVSKRVLGDSSLLANRLMIGVNNNEDGGGDSSSSNKKQMKKNTASLLNSQSWNEILKFSDSIMIDTNTSTLGLIFGMSSSTSPTGGFSVASFSAPAQQQKSSSMMSASEFSKQTDKSNEAIKTVHFCLQRILHSAVKSGSGENPPTKEMQKS